MKLIRHPVAALVIFALFVSLVITAYDGIKVSYDLQEEYTQEIEGEDVNIMQAFKNLNIIEGLNQTTAGISSIATPTGSTFDILGSLASSAVGALKTVTGLLTFPFEIGSIILRYYGVPPILVTGINLIIVIYIGFILLSAYLKSEV